MDQATIKTYDRYSQIYDREVIEFWSNFPKSTINEFCKRLRGLKVLDLGSGSGRDAIILRDVGLEIICCDASTEMAKITRNLGFETIQSSFDDLELEDNSFDGIWSYTSLLHISKEEVSKVLAKVFKIVKSDGVFLIGMIEGVFEGDVERESMPGEKRFFRFYEENELKEIVESVGFKFQFQEKYKPNSKTYLAQIYKKI